MTLPATTTSLLTDLLLKKGLLMQHQVIAIEPMAGNPERLDFATRQRFRVCTNDGTAIALLIYGKNLKELISRTELFSRTYPDLACPILATTTLNEAELLLTEYFNGVTAGEALAHPNLGEQGVLAALQRLAERLKQEIRPSTTEAMAREIEALKLNVLRMPYWSPADHSFLDSIVFPYVSSSLLKLQPTTRVTNGDFVLSNILLNAQGDIRIIDYEQAAATHFHEEDWLRFTYWKTPAMLREFALTQVRNPEAIQLYLWLKQIYFEAEVNLPAKAKSDILYWGRKIRNYINQNDCTLKNNLLFEIQGISEYSAELRQLSEAHYNYNQAIDLCGFSTLLKDEIDSRGNAIYQQALEINRQRDLKIKQMQSSFSWKATAWLRALRRQCLDPFFPKSAPRLPALPIEALINVQAITFSTDDFHRPAENLIQYHIESPIDWDSADAEIDITGWAYTELPIKLTQVRARINGRIYAGQYGLDQPVIAEKFHPKATSGFHIYALKQNTDTSIIIEVSDEQNAWHTFFSSSFKYKLNSPQQTPLLYKNYAAWAVKYSTLTSRQLEALREKSVASISHPLISVLMPVYNTPARYLTKAIESVRAQVYPYWEFCIADDCSTQPQVRELLEHYAKVDSRIKPVFRLTNGHISAATNSAVDIATGDYVAFLDHDDELAPHALYCIAQLLTENPSAEIIYSDEDKIDEEGNRFMPHFKPDWNPDLLTSQNYFCHLTTYKTATLRAVGGLRVGYEGSQDWDLALRITEKIKPNTIFHISQVLYHWRAIEGSTAATLSAKEYTGEASRKALEDHFARQGQSVILKKIIGGHWWVKRPLPVSLPLITLIIPTRNRQELLVKCVESILDKTSYRNFEILIADNESDDPTLIAYYAKMKKRGRFSVVHCPGPFNFSAINNTAVKQANGELIGLLNNDLEVMHPEWLDEMAAHALRPEIGVVGAKLYYPDMTVQHAGVILGIGGVAGHAFKHFPRNDPGTPQVRPHVIHNVSALTAACIVLRKSVYNEAGGLDENNLKIAFNDVDFCLKVLALGYRNLFTPFAELIHHESASRGAEDSPEKIARFQTEILYMQNRWGAFLENDPAYNPNLTLKTEDFDLAWSPRSIISSSKITSVRSLVF